MVTVIVKLKGTVPVHEAECCAIIVISVKNVMISFVQIAVITMTLIAANVVADAVMNVVYEVIDKDNRIAQNASKQLLLLYWWIRTSDCI